MGKYNGHKNWNHWNVALWLFNNKELYQQMSTYVANCRTLDEAATVLATQLKGQKTPDGAQYSYSAIRQALRGTKG